MIKEAYEAGMQHAHEELEKLALSFATLSSAAHKAERKAFMATKNRKKLDKNPLSSLVPGYRKKRNSLMDEGAKRNAQSLRFSQGAYAKAKKEGKPRDSLSFPALKEHLGSTTREKIRR